MHEKIKVMIVEDNFLNRKLATDLLELEGYWILPCPDAESALEILKTDSPAIILMDVALPGMDGLELTRLLKAEPKTKDIKIIALTAFAMLPDKTRVMDAGCDGYITKPIDTRKFPGQILEYLK